VRSVAAGLSVQIERLIEYKNGEFFLGPEMFDDRRHVIMGRIYFLADVNDFVGNLSAAVLQKCSQAFRH
jgi:hypothetical protein